jgi:hypothetical protein
MTKWLLFLSLAVAASARAQESFEKRQAERQQALQARIDAELAIGKVGFRLDDWGWRRAELIARVRLQNNMSAPAQDFKVSCAAYNKAGAALPPANVVVYRQLKPRERGIYEINFRRISPQISTLSCSVNDWRT